MWKRIDDKLSKKKLEIDNKRKERQQRRDQEALRQAFDAKDETGSVSPQQTQTQTTKEFYDNLLEGPPLNGSDPPEGVGASLSRPWSMANPEPIPRSGAGQPSRVPIMNRGRNATGTEPIGSGGLPELREDAFGSGQDLNKILPPEPNEQSLSNETSLRSLFANRNPEPTPPIPQRRTAPLSHSKKLRDNVATVKTALDDELPAPRVPLHGFPLHGATIPMDTRLQDNTSFVSSQGSEASNEPIEGSAHHPPRREGGKFNGSSDKSRKVLVDRTHPLREGSEESSTDEESPTEKTEPFRDRQRTKPDRNQGPKISYDELVRQIQEMKEEAARKERDTNREIGKLEGSITTLKELQENHRIEKKELVESHKQQLKSTEENASKELSETRRSLESRLLKEQSDHAATKEAQEEKIETLRAEHIAEENEIQQNLLEQKKQLQKKFRSEKSALEEENRVACEKHRKELNGVMTELAQERGSKEREMTELNKKYIEEMQQAKDEFQWRLTSANEKLERIQKEKAQDVQSIRSERDNAVKQAEWKYQSLLDDARSEFDRESKAKDKEIRDLKSQQGTAIHLAGESFRQRLEGKAQEMETMRTEYEARFSSMKANYELNMAKALQGLQETNEVLQRALVKRSRFKAISDGEVASRFQQGIVIEVDELARVPWDKRCQSRWPFSEQALEHSTNKKQAKQAKRFVIQNNMWVILYEKIFCTPFRVFGSEGRVMEEEWLEMFGQGSLFPIATQKSEQWRYEKITTCVEVIGQPLMASDPNYSIKQGYESTLEEVSEELIQELNNISMVGDIEKKRISQVVNKAAKLWLDVGQLRCRMFLVMSELGETVKPIRSRESSLKRDGTLDLVVLPELRRLGNVEGELLDKNDLVKGCEGKFSVFRTR